MLSAIYKKTIIDYPKISLSLIIILLLFSFYFSKDFKLDASSDALLLEGDKDLKYLLFSYLELFPHLIYSS